MRAKMRLSHILTNYFNMIGELYESGRYATSSESTFGRTRFVAVNSLPQISYLY